MSTIVLGYNATEQGRAALEEAIRQAGFRSSRVVVVSSHHGGARHTGDREVELQDELTRVRARLDETGLAFTIRPLVRGMGPAEDVVAVAQETAAELVVIGLRRRSPVGKLIIGSRAQRILLKAPCPVLAVKAG